MSGIKSIIGLVAGALALYWHKIDLDAEYQRKEKELAEERQEYLDELDKKDKIINPNGDANQPPVSIVGTVTMGGVNLNMLQIVLSIKNNSTIPVELEDWRCELYVGGYKSNAVLPATTLGITIPAGQTRDFRLYARGDVAFPYGTWKSVKNSLCKIANVGYIGAGAYIKADLIPAELDVEVVWDVEGEKQPAFIYNVPCAFSFPYTGWTVGVWTGYNAGNKAQNEASGSFWNDYYKANE